MRNTILLSMLMLLIAGACAPKHDGGGSGDTTGNASATGSVDSSALTALAPGSENQFITSAGDRVFFAYDQFSLSDSAQNTLRKQAEWLKKYGDAIAIIEGHADERGTREYNLALGARRANAVREFLIAEGIASDRLDTISYGKERPHAIGSHEGAWAQNRRSVTRLQ